MRVVDSCAGCAKASKHVDLTQAAFKELADLDTGLLIVQMRQATDPADGWYVYSSYLDLIYMNLYHTGWNTFGGRRSEGGKSTLLRLNMHGTLEV